MNFEIRDSSNKPFHFSLQRRKTSTVIIATVNNNTIVIANHITKSSQITVTGAISIDFVPANGRGEPENLNANPGRFESARDIELIKANEVRNSIMTKTISSRFQVLNTSFNFEVLLPLAQ